LAVRSRIDARSDVYALGRVLAELLGAAAPEPAGAPSPRPPRPGPAVSTGLADLVGKCLAASPDDRYPDAASLAEDLRRQMADLPLRGVPNRDLRERWIKWCRRRPYELFRLKTFVVAGCAALAIAAICWLAFLAPRLRAASHALADGQAMLDRGDYAAAARALTRGAALIEGLPGADRLSRDLAAALALTDRLEEADRLHTLVDRLRFAESAANRPVASARDVERNCRALWASRLALLDRPGSPLDPRVERRLRDDLLDLVVIGSGLRVRLEPDKRRAAEAHRAALALLDEAEASLGPSHVLYLARQAHAAALGLAEHARAARRCAERVAPRTAWEHDAAGRVRLATGDLAAAEASFERALELRPQDLWPNFHRGLCAFRRGRYQDALTAFSVCVALDPGQAECFYNRALAHAALGHTASAWRDYEHAVALDPALAAVPVDRRTPHGPLSTTPPGAP
jgi:tetratricopeptide (TPR) repeat protein